MNGLQSSKLRDRRQAHGQKEKTKKSKGMSTPELLAELSVSIILLRFDPEFIKTILCIYDTITFSLERLFS